MDPVVVPTPSSFTYNFFKNLVDVNNFRPVLTFDSQNLGSAQVNKAIK